MLSYVISLITLFSDFLKLFQALNFLSLYIVKKMKVSYTPWRSIKYSIFKVTQVIFKQHQYFLNYVSHDKVEMEIEKGFEILVAHLNLPINPIF